MRTGVTTSLYFLPGTRTADLERIKAHGYDCVDYDLCDTTDAIYHLPEEQFAAAMKAERQKIEAAGLKVSQVHGPWPTDDTTSESRAEKYIFMQRAVGATALLGCPYMVVHPVMPYGWSKETDADTAQKMNEEFFAKLCDYAAGYGVGICVENMPMTAHRISPINRIVQLVKAVNKPNFFICLDTGHCNELKDDCGEAVRKSGKYLKVLHVHDNCGRRDSHLIPYCGTIQWEHFTDALKEIGFDGVLSIETKVRRDFPGEMREYMLTGLAAIARALAAQSE